MASQLHKRQRAIESYFLAKHGDEADVVGVKWPGVTFDAETDATSGAWTQFDVLWGEGVPATQGGSGLGTNDVVGVVSMNFWIRPGTGMGEVAERANDARTWFNRVSLDSDLVRFGAPTGLVPIEDGDRWIGYNVSVDFLIVETI